MSDAAYRPGLEGVIAGETSISTLAHGLSYRGYAVEDLAQAKTWEEVIHLILYGELPNAGELEALQQRLAAAATLPPQLVDFLKTLPTTANQMDVIRTAASALAHWDVDAQDLSREASLRKAERLLVQVPMAMATAWRVREGKEPLAYQPQLSLPANILWLLFRKTPSADAAKALGISLILYAEHEFAASSFSARVICSTRSDLHSAVTAGIGALKGPLHGGANALVIDVLQRIKASGDPEQWVHQALVKKERIMGFGHRVYKNGDPRAAVLKPFCERLSHETGNEEMEASAETTEAIVLAQKKLYPNVDWPTGRLYHYLGLPVQLYTPLFAVARIAGWSAHYIEQQANNRLIRPAAIYTGPAPRPVL